MPEIVEVMGCEVHNIDLAEAIESMLDAAQSAPPSFAVTPNVDHLVRFRRSPRFREAYARASIRVADGMPLLWAARLKGSPLKQRVAGSDLIAPLCSGARERGLSVFLLGGSQGAAVEAAKRLQESYPGLIVAGTSCPPIGFHANPKQNAEAVAEVRRASPDILFVGLGSPKQEFWISDNLEELGVPFSMGVGITIEFTAGYVRRAPEWMRERGLEWAYRISRERRLLKRYLWTDLPFLAYLARLALLRAVGRSCD